MSEEVKRKRGRFDMLPCSIMNDGKLFACPPSARALYYELRVVSAGASLEGFLPSHQVKRLPGYRNIGKLIAQLIEARLISEVEKGFVIHPSETEAEPSAHLSRTYPEPTTNLSQTYEQPISNLSQKKSLKKQPSPNTEKEGEEEVEKEPPIVPHGDRAKADSFEGPARARVRSSDIDKVEQTYLDQLAALRKKQGKPPPRKRRLLEPERKKVAVAVKAVGVDGAQAAVRGMFATPHNLGQNDRKTEYLSIDIAMRPSNLDRFIGKSGEAARKPLFKTFMGEPVYENTPIHSLTRQEVAQRDRILKEQREAQNAAAC